MKKEIVYVGGRGDDDDKKGRHHMGQRAEAQMKRWQDTS